MVLLFIYTIDVVVNRFDLDADALYKEYLEYLDELKEEGDIDEEYNEYSKQEIIFIFYFIKGLTIFVVPAAILIYRSRIISLPAFVVIKKHQGRR